MNQWPQAALTWLTWLTWLTTTRDGPVLVLLGLVLLAIALGLWWPRTGGDPDVRR